MTIKEKFELFKSLNIFLTDIAPGVRLVRPFKVSKVTKYEVYFIGEICIGTFSFDLYDANKWAIPNVYQLLKKLI